MRESMYNFMDRFIKETNISLGPLMFWKIFVDPIKKKSDVVRDLQSRQLSTILLLLIIILSLVVIVTLYGIMQLTYSFYWMLFLDAALLTSYVLARFNCYALASVFSILVFFAGIFGSPVITGMALSYIFIVALPVQLFTMHISLKGLVKMLLISIAIIALLSFLYLHNGIKISLLPTSLFLTMSILVLVSVYHRDKIEGEQKDQLIRTKNATIFALAYQAELRDHQTGQHLERTSSYVHLLARDLRKKANYSTYLDESYINDLVKASLLHDIGKVAIPDSILQKRGKLTEEEYEEIKKHCYYGTLVLQKAEEPLSFQSFFDLAIQITHSHHEKWDGSGYPRQLCGDEIALSARIMSLADVYDALRSKRVYKDEIDHNTCCEIIAAEKGKHFDPQIVESFLNRRNEFNEISESLTGYSIVYEC